MPENNRLKNKRTGKPKGAGRTGNAGNAKTAGHSKKTGYPKRSGSARSNRYTKKDEYSRDTGRPGSNDFTKSTRYPKKTRYNKKDGDSKNTGYSKSAGYSKNAGHTSEIRLNKYIANAGICSRRQADLYILAGLVSVNGKPIDRLGTKVLPGDKVSFNKNIIKDEKKVYILMNKPKDCVTTVDDPSAKITVMDILGRKFAERVYPVGRLDRNTTGVLLLTNDGELTQQLTHPSHNKKKIYHVFLDKKLTHADLIKITKGLALEDGFIKPDAVNYADPADRAQVGIELHSGKNRIVRRIFEALGYKILKLDRVYFAGLTKKGLNRGQWRFLTEREINMLKMNAYE